MATLPVSAYEVCPLDDLPPVFSDPELAALFVNLQPGQSQDVSQNFLRVAAPWPYLDIRGPGNSGGGDMPNEPRAVFLLRSTHPAAPGPLLLVAPAQLRHRLKAATDGGLPHDSWTIAKGPFAPTIYGRWQTGRKLRAFVAHPTKDPAVLGVFGPKKRASLTVQIFDFLDKK